ncbi:terminase gpP N-terminus-related DNA-binding protein [Carnobacterium funditum]
MLRQEEENARVVKRAIKLYKSQQYSVEEITEMTGIRYATLYRYVKNH